MRPLSLLFLGAISAFSQPFSAGLKAGVPLTDFINTVQNASTTVPNRYIVGAMAEVRLPFGLGVEFDALYRHLNYTSRIVNPVNTITTDRTTASSWEFPLLLKYRFKAPLVRPYLESGIAWDTLSGVTDTISVLTNTVLNTTSSSKPAALANNTTAGIVLGAGVDIHALLIHVSPELRYTRWSSQHFNLNGVLSSNQNQAEFLVGITF
jgi:hypothetical protein